MRRTEFRKQERLIPTEDGQRQTPKEGPQVEESIQVHIARGMESLGQFDVRQREEERLREERVGEELWYARKLKMLKGGLDYLHLPSSKEDIVENPFIATGRGPSSFQDKPFEQGNNRSLENMVGSLQIIKEAREIESKLEVLTDQKITHKYIEIILYQGALARIFQILEENELERIKEFFQEHPELKERSISIFNENLEIAARNCARISSSSADEIARYLKNSGIEFYYGLYANLGSFFNLHIVNSFYYTVNNYLNEKREVGTDDEIKRLDALRESNRPRAEEYIESMKKVYSGIAKLLIKYKEKDDIRYPDRVLRFRERISDKINNWSTMPIEEPQKYAEGFLNEIQSLMEEEIVREGYLLRIADFGIKRCFINTEIFWRGRNAIMEEKKEVFPYIWLYAISCEPYVGSTIQTIVST